MDARSCRELEKAGRLAAKPMPPAETHFSTVLKAAFKVMALMTKCLSSPGTNTAKTWMKGSMKAYVIVEAR